jgi:thiamine-monophosphate kinase
MAIGEFELIDRHFRKLGASRADVILGVGDDGAILRPPPDCDLVAVSDTLVEGVHFPAGSAPRSIGHRALAVNLSDIAAMGAPGVCCRSRCRGSKTAGSTSSLPVSAS